MSVPTTWLPTTCGTAIGSLRRYGQPRVEPASAAARGEGECVSNFTVHSIEVRPRRDGFSLGQYWGPTHDPRRPETVPRSYVGGELSSTMTPRGKARGACGPSRRTGSTARFAPAAGSAKIAAAAATPRRML